MPVSSRSLTDSDRRPGLLGLLLGVVLVAGCRGTSSETGDSAPSRSATVTAEAGAGGSIEPRSVTVMDGETAAFTVSTDDAHHVGRVVGCGGTLSGDTYTTAAISADCTVSASFVPFTHAVTTDAGVGGTLDPPATMVVDGQTTTLTVAPDPTFAIGAVTGCGGTLTGGAYTTAPITSDCTVRAIFVLSHHTVTATAGPGGSIGPQLATVLDGQATALTVIPDPTFAIESVAGCGGTLTGDTYSIPAVTADCAVTASFVPFTHTVTATAGVGGSIDPSTTSVFNGETATLAVTPDATFGIDAVTGCGGALSGDVYTTASITGDCAVSASFLPVRTVTATAGTGGIIAPPTASILEGQTTAFTVTPDPTFAIDAVTGCDGGLSGDIYTTAAVTADCAIAASFVPFTHTVTALASHGGTIGPLTAAVLDGQTTTLTVTPSGGFAVETVTGCGGTLSGDTYTTAAILADCTVSAAFTPAPVTFTTGQPASVVIGQPDFASGGAGTSQSQLFSPFGTPAFIDGVLYVSDGDNFRVLGFDGIPTSNGAPASFVIGASDFETKGDLAYPTGLDDLAGMLFVPMLNQGDYFYGYQPIPTADTPGTRYQIWPRSPVLDGVHSHLYLGGSAGVSTGGGKVVVADSVNNRVLVYDEFPASYLTEAVDVVLGQPDFYSFDPALGAQGMTFPSGVWTDGERIVVLDAYNHRVLVWNTWPTEDGQAADLVLGQPDFTTGSSGPPTASSLSGPLGGVWVHLDQLFVADTENRRVLVWNTWPTENGQAADVVLGQPDSTSFTPGPTQTRMVAPSGITLVGDQLVVTDFGSHRILVFDGTTVR